MTDLAAITHAYDCAVREIERLARALEDIRSRSSIDFLAMRSYPFEITAMLGDIHQIADAALAKEDE